jgi:glycosyltransferase involved in cell wall biosynthesis
MGVQEQYGIPADRVVRIYPGLPATGTGDPESGRDRAGARRYLLFLGSIEPRKNLTTLVRAFDRVAGIDPELRLVLAGRPGPDADAVARVVSDSRHGDRVVLPGYVDARARLDLLAGSTVFTFPSHDEGFGYPPLEAMAAGVPVVAASAGSLPEVLGDAALLVEPTDPDALASAIEQALSDDDLRATLAERGLRRARLFDWDTTACQLAALYARLARS